MVRWFGAGVYIVVGVESVGNGDCYSMSKLSFSFSSKPKAAPLGAAPALKKPAAFGDLGDDDEPIDAALTSSSSARADVNKRLAAQGASTSTAGGALSRTAKKKLQQEIAVDPTVYEYDEVYDRMKEAEVRAKAIKEDEAAERKVCMQAFLPSFYYVSYKNCDADDGFILAKIHRLALDICCDAKIGPRPCGGIHDTT